ncbi:MAG: cell division protein ZapA [Oscillospiraceae bacterium]|nr:cell division protein ZapA [Oscillospiraceae bacterium]
MAANRIRIRVCGSEYVIASTDSEEYVQGLAKQLDEEMCAFLDQNPAASVTTAAVLAALGYMDEKEKASNGADNMRAQIKDYLEDAAKAKMDAEEARRALSDAKYELERLRRELGYTRDES